jgi:ATP-binding cassette, subfamily B, bacterial
MRKFAGVLNRYFRADIYRRLLPYMLPYKRPMAVVLSITLLQTGLSLLDPWPMAMLIDNGLRGNPLPSWAGNIFPFLIHQAGAIIVFAVVAGVVLRLVGSVMDLFGTYLKTRVNDSIVMNFKADFFNHLQRLSFTYHDRTTVGDSMYRLGSDTGFVSTLIWGNFRHLLTSFVTLGAMVWIVFSLDRVLAVISLGVAPVLYGSAMYYGKYFKEKSKRVKSMESMSGTVVQEVLSCLRVVKAFGTEDREQRRFEDTSWAALRARWRLSLEQNIYGSGLSLISKIFRSVVLLIGGFHVLHGELTLGQLTVIIAYVSGIHGPLEDTGSTLMDMQTSLASAERVLEVLDIDPEIQDKPGAKDLGRVKGELRFEHVSFGYYADRLVLHDVSFHAPEGSVTAMVGPTGAGKTTLSNLIARFYDPSSGSVTLDGHDLRDLTVKTVRDNTSLVIQEPILFSGTIRENIAYGRPDASTDEIVQAAMAANAHDFISILPDGYGTEVGARGVMLSGGERQRISIARAFLKEAPILILDEPTSSVDSRTELVILNALDRLMVGRTTFIIAHRLSTIRRADEVLVLEDGCIRERGGHRDLIRQNGLYAQLYHIQSAALRETEDGGPAISVADWIVDGRPDVTHEEIVAAAMAANADAFIKELPQVYDTVIGEGGIRLSAEQRLRMARARTILAEVVEKRKGGHVPAGQPPGAPH